MSDDSSNPFVDAVNAGLSPIPVDTSTKRPLVRWATFQESPAERLQLLEWAHCNIGIVCGQVSGRLLCIDIEVGFLEGHGLKELAKRLNIAGVHDLWWSWMEGYCESTARGGLHVLIRLEGQGPIEGNRKLAMASPTDVLIETRGEGGYAVVAPSRNGSASWELLRGGFDTIAYATTDEWDRVAAVLSSFDAGPPGTTRDKAPPLPEQVSDNSFAGVDMTPTTLRLGDSWVEDALAQLPNIRTVLSAHAWEPANSRDQYGEHWTRPGKDTREGHSASISETDRLFVHSTNAGLPTGNPTLDVLDVILAYQLGRRPDRNERVSYLRQYRSDHPGGEVIERAEGKTAPSATPSMYLDDDFWQARSWLAALRDTALARMLSPDAVLGAFLSAYATTIPMGIWVPAVVGARAPLNTYCTIVAVSGGGKTAAMTVASDLLGSVDNPDVRLGNSLRSGEGLITLVLKPTKKRRGEEEQFEPSFNAGVQVHFDEGGTLGKQVERAGSTTIPYLNTAWAGAGVVGGAKASDSAGFPAKAVRITCVMGVQYGAAANLFTGEAERLGFPQRLLYFGNDNPILEDLDVDTMSEAPIVPLDLPRYQHSEFTRFPQEMAVPAEIKREVRLWTKEKTVHGLTNPLDGHRMNLRLRVASIFALMEGRFDIDVSDWGLALAVERTSRAIRSRLVQSLGDLSLQQARQRGRLDAMRQEASNEMFLESAALSLAKKVARSKHPVTKRQAKDHLRSFHRRYHVDYLSAIETALSRQWVISTASGDLRPGPAARTLVGGSGGS